MIESVLVSAAIWLAKESAGRLLDLGKDYLENHMGTGQLHTQSPDKKSSLDNYIDGLTGRLDTVLTAKLYGALSQLRDADRAASPNDLLNQALISFHEVANYPNKDATTEAHSTELRCLAYIGMAQAYIMLKERQELIAEKMVEAIYTDPKTAREWLGDNVVQEIIKRYPPSSLTQRVLLSRIPVFEEVRCPKCGHMNRVGAKYCSRDGAKLEQGSPGTILLTYNGNLETVNTLAWSPDGKHIASGGDAIEVWNVATGKVLLAYSEHKGRSTAINALAWSPDGQSIVSAGSDQTVRVWNVTSGKTVLTYSAHRASILSLVWSPDGKFVASGSADHVIHIWDAVNGQTIFKYERNPFRFSKTRLASDSAIAWSPVSSRIAIAGSPVEIIDATTGNALLRYDKHLHLSPALTVDWSPDGKHVASGGKDKTVQIWNANTGYRLLTYPGHTSWIRVVAWSPDSKRIASVSNDKSIHLWEATTGQLPFIYRYSNPSSTIASMKWSPDGDRLALGGVEEKKGTVVILQV